MIIKSCKNRLFSSIALLSFGIPAFAVSGHVYLGGSVAASFAQLGNQAPSISYFSGAIITDMYPLHNKQVSAPTFGVNGGYEFAGADWKPAVAVGLGVYSNFVKYRYHGEVIETAEGDPSSTLYNFRFRANSTRLMAEAQFNWMFTHVAPFINVGIGSAWNKMSRYQESEDTLTSYPPLPPFESHTKENFAYQAGIGLSKSFSFSDPKFSGSQERISVGYRYVNLGTTTFGTRGEEYPYRLNTKVLQTNDVYLNYTHLF